MNEKELMILSNFMSFCNNRVRSFKECLVSNPNERSACKRHLFAITEICNETSRIIRESDVYAPNDWLEHIEIVALDACQDIEKSFFEHLGK